MLKLLESKLRVTTDFSDLMKECSDYRQQSAHHVGVSSEKTMSYSQKFYDLCKRICIAGESFSSMLNKSGEEQENG